MSDRRNHVRCTTVDDGAESVIQDGTCRGEIGRSRVRWYLEAYGTGDCLKNSDGDHGTIAPGCMPSDCMAAIDCKPSVI